jgi:hypothetical protein
MPKNNIFVIAVTGSLVGSAMGHGAMVSPVPRSSHNQTLDDRNSCGAKNPYSTAGIYPGEYCGVGCMGDSCLYYQVGCFAGCPTCSLAGKDLYPTSSDLALAGNCKPIKPTLGGGDAAHEYELRTYNVDGDSAMGDWTAPMPWRAPGSTGKGNPDFSPCGINSGSSGSLPPTTATDVPIGHSGTELPSLGSTATWKRGATAEASWAIYANHGGGYSYRICKKSDGLTEDCFQRTPLDFVGNTTRIHYADGSKADFEIDAVQTNVGTHPAGSMWRKSPVPMCNCDIGTNCGRKAEAAVEAPATDGGKQCVADPQCQGNDFNCKECDSSGPAWSCKTGTCCPGFTEADFSGGVFCKAGSGPAPAPSPKPSNTMYDAYKHTHLRPGQTSKLCPTGVQYETKFDDGAGASGGGGFGRFMFTMIDTLQVPANIDAGEYVLSWRWDCEETPQVWNSCADITIE